MRIVTVVGARPQFIKASVVSRAIKKQSAIEELIVHTGQHYDRSMSDIFFDQLEIPQPFRHLGIGSGPHGQQTARMLEALEKLLMEIRPDGLLVYGDTNSTLAGALAAAKLHIPVVHVEAGLRSFNRAMPEEINRVVTDHLATILFAPTASAQNQLCKEGIDPAKIFVSGDVMLDVFLFSKPKALETWDALKTKLSLGDPYILATLHRAENTDHPVRLKNIFQALDAIAQKRRVLFPLHPRTRQALEKLNLLNNSNSKIEWTEPLGYLEMIALEMHSQMIVTDSGGVQKEAYFAKVPCVTLRDETEWTELVDHGWNTLVPPDSPELADKILAACKQSRSQENLYGTGQAAELIVGELMSRLRDFSKDSPRE